MTDTVYKIEFKPENPTINQYEKGKADWSGVYIWKNCINGKRYVGKSYKMSKRPYRHIYSGGSAISLAFKKYGLENFTLSLYEIEPDKIDTAEQWFIKIYDTFKGNGYNKTLGGEGSLGVEVSEETREKLRAVKQNMSEETKEKMRIAKKSKPMSDEHRERLRIINTGNKYNLGRSPSEETREKLRVANLGSSLSDEHKEKLKRPKTEEHKAKISDGVARMHERLRQQRRLSISTTEEVDGEEHIPLHIQQQCKVSSASGDGLIPTTLSAKRFLQRVERKRQRQQKLLEAA